jgi:uncharacterized protein YfdQ (DUF2303 family)
MNEISNAQVIADLTRQAFSSQTIDGNEFVIIPSDCKVESLERFKAVPSRRKGKISFFDLKSFVKYVGDYKTQTTKVFYSDKTSQKHALIAVFDFYPQEDQTATWREDRAEYEILHSEEWNKWVSKNNFKFDQTGFAEFVEINAAHFVEPHSATMLEIAQTLSVKTNVDFKSAVRNSNGNQSIHFSEISESKAGQNGDIEVPQRILLALSPFGNGPKYEIAAFLRIRIVDRKISFFYDLINTHLIIEDAVNEMTSKIEEETGISVLRGVA